MSPQSCSCRRWAWVVLSGILLTLFPLVLRTVCIAVCRSHSHCLSDVVCILLLLLLSICWLGCTSSLSIVVSICLLHLLLKLLLSRSASLITVVEFSVFSNNCGSALSISPTVRLELVLPFFEGTIFSCECWWLSFCTCACWSALVLLYLLLVASPFAAAWYCHCCFLLFSSRCVLLYVRVRSGVFCGSPGLSNQDCLLRYHVKINSTCTRCDCMSLSTFALWAIVSVTWPKGPAGCIVYICCTRLVSLKNM